MDKAPKHQDPEDPAPNSEELQQIEELLVSRDPDIFDNLPYEQKQAILEGVSITMMSSFSSGPIPDARSMKQYNESIPNGADRIMIMAEKQQQHRMEMEKMVATRQMSQSQKGQYFGFTISILVLALILYLSVNGHTSVAGILGSVTIVSLVAVFVTGKVVQNKKD